jgi:ketosteroid isomerase-like protein
MVNPGFAQTKGTRPKPHRSSQASAAQKRQFADDQQAINALHDKDIQASLALDANALESLWTDDIVTMAPGAPPLAGREANRARLDKQLEQMKSVEILSYNEQFQEVQVVGDWAWEYGSITGRTRPFSGGEETEMHFNLLRVLKRQPDGTYRIARTIYNDAKPPQAPPEPKKEEPREERNKLKD